MDMDNLRQPTFVVQYDEPGNQKRIDIAWPDPEHKPRFVKITPELLEEIVDQLNDRWARLCLVCDKEH